MRNARVAVLGGVYDAVVEDDRGELLRLSDGRRVLGEDVVWLPPVRPGTIVALGLNYSDHANELAFDVPADPLIFLKGPNTLLGHRGVTRRPADADAMHYECELVVVIGRTARRVSRTDAYDYVRGYAVANDYVIRGYIENYYRPNLRAKNRDGSTVLGPWIVDAQDVPNPMNLNLRTTVNGKVTQEGCTTDMVFDIPFLIEHLTAFMTLSPGDLILTGTPKGVAYLEPDDIVVTEIDGVGRLESTVVDDARFYAARSRK
jgi:5-oxopent-3-ene-1,2,5-tricarboxylate decarboxylase/2-hydroxyhepta-2,4-diene-1,7-dioate isomerase